MTETLEGVRDPLRADPDAENAVAVFAMHPPGSDDMICDVDADGVARHPESGDPVPWASYSIEATDVDPETWGDHYHPPADCPEKDPPASNSALLRSTCDGCTIAEDRERDREYYRPEIPDDFDAEEFREALGKAIVAVGANARERPSLMVSEEMADALEEEVQDAG